jgi:hypothetical protein
MWSILRIAGGLRQANLLNLLQILEPEKIIDLTSQLLKNLLRL